MYQIHSTRSMAELLTLIDEQQSVIDELSMSHLGILAPAATRRALRLMTEPCDLICIDLRKLHDLNEVLGYDIANRYFGVFARTRMHDEPCIAPRPHDVRGQWGGDELVIACAVDDGLGLLMRLVAALDALTAELTPAQRHALAQRTGGLVSGFAAVFVLIPNSTRPLCDAARGIDECGALKKGSVTGNRSTSGKPGTIIGTLTPATSEVCTP